MREEDYAIFPLAIKPEDGDLEVIANLNEHLKKMGGSIRVSQSDYHGEQRYLHICFNRETAKEYLSRGAGRPQKQTCEKITVGEVKQMLTQYSASDVAAHIGISRSTLFRRLKWVEENQIEDCWPF